jgi:hypothetical protein
MERYQEQLDTAKKKLQIADHMVNVTYPLVRDTKLLYASVENLFLSLTSTMGALLHFERLYKRIPPFNDTFESKYFMYNHMLQEKFRLDSEYSKMMKDIKKIIVEHKKSPVEFQRRDKFVICSQNYSTMVLTYPTIREYLTKAKLFIQEINTIINKNEG